MPKYDAPDEPEPTIYYVFSDNIDGKPIIRSHGIFYNIDEDIHTFMNKLYFPSGEANPDMMSLYGMACFHLLKLQKGEDKTLVSFLGPNNTRIYVYRDIESYGWREDFYIVAAKKDISTNIEIVYTGDDLDEANTTVKEWRNAGYMAFKWWELLEF